MWLLDSWGASSGILVRIGCRIGCLSCSSDITSMKDIVLHTYATVGLHRPIHVVHIDPGVPKCTSSCRYISTHRTLPQLIPIPCHILTIARRGPRAAQHRQHSPKDRHHSPLKRPMTTHKGPKSDLRPSTEARQLPEGPSIENVDE